MVLFTFSLLDRKHFFGANLFQKIKILKLSWNLVSRLIQICRIQWWCSLFFIPSGIPLWANFVQKIKIVSLSWNLIPRLIWTCRMQWWCSAFLFYTGNTLLTVSAAAREQRLWNRQLPSTQFFCFVAVRAFVDCFCALS